MRHRPGESKSGNSVRQPTGSSDGQINGGHGGAWGWERGVWDVARGARLTLSVFGLRAQREEALCYGRYWPLNRI